MWAGGSVRISQCQCLSWPQVRKIALNPKYEIVKKERIDNLSKYLSMLKKRSSADGKEMVVKALEMHLEENDVERKAKFILELGGSLT
jgi:hypothetical protein